MQAPTPLKPSIPPPLPLIRVASTAQASYGSGAKGGGDDGGDQLMQAPTWTPLTLSTLPADSCTGWHDGDNEEVIGQRH
jgi:hypothetical protein